MSSRVLFLAAAAALLGTITYGSSAYALSEHEIIRLHTACQAGDSAACVHRDAVIHDRAHETEWRRIHPEWYR
jgi:hypothetical protein